MREPLAEQGRNGRSESPDALAALIAGEELRALSRSIEQLPAQQREALVLHEFCGLPYGEVAAAIGVSESAIGSLLFRARTSLRSAFRRGYAVLPLPEIWNASAQLLARGPAIKVAALPMVAKIGCGAVAVGLSAGAVVAVDHEVGTQSRPRSVPRVGGSGDAVRGESACARQPAGGREVGGPGVGDGDGGSGQPPSVPVGRRLRVPSTGTGLVPSPRPRQAGPCPRRSPRSWSHPPRHHPRDTPGPRRPARAIHTFPPGADTSTSDTVRASRPQRRRRSSTTSRRPRGRHRLVGTNTLVPPGRNRRLRRPPPLD